MTKAVYIHIPFCTNKCYYCDFNSYVTKNPQLVWDYLDALNKEMEETVRRFPPGEIKTIFVGGGTPTFLDPKQMAHFLETVRRHFPQWSADIEFTMEANPGTTDIEKLSIMREGGVNRISFGVQSFDDRLLKRIGRIHDSEQVLRSLENAKRTGFDNISIDLIFGLPDQTVAHFQDTLDKAFGLDLPHFSSYSLKVEENTLFHTLYEKDQLPLPTEDEEVLMYERLMEQMAKRGYRQYEISNFARPGFESRHNMTYWRNEYYYGIGAGAHGYVNGERHVNASPLAQYMQLTVEKGLPRVEQFTVSGSEQMEDHMIMGLRMMEGVSASDFQHRYGITLQEQFSPVIDELTALGLLMWSGDRLHLTRRGIPLGNEVFARFLGLVDKV
ncbi:radical SAM family heme chaperone HemW [Aneurinibacillus migulanus]|uniref:Heme chaperone HemW n=1 Tax=Aneurinibacillus migulanus TaxID=47500 RepID=A0A0D1YC37_ANEMI|nr:radical SAM family heme chaperone HemW [Aneurinibacillus migulanus]KIV56617.1 coproporphyrinogen III oxidase [Aneurinibacillus migulanus]KON95377.1 coproporphyrinogen III oxidase [Aneurinibacillus migulanus]MED0893670.1 radical SAM family heme chaperone HemW [Aneurinibacillus migulanus]MED1617826.1 radical SAM family heme chaperone HemW [Aneurinibacillus migulanus]SDI67924.1 oxygen-independent coproporphyrinogen-3 oxidase [Aneurinibacillus migulanus]